MDMGIAGHGWLWDLVAGAIRLAIIGLTPILGAYVAKLRQGKMKDQAWGELLTAVGAILAGSWSELLPVVKDITADGKVERAELERLELEAIAVVKRKMKEEVVERFRRQLGPTLAPMFDDMLRGVVGAVVRQQLPTAASVPLATALPASIQSVLNIAGPAIRP